VANFELADPNQDLINYSDRKIVLPATKLPDDPYVVIADGRIAVDPGLAVVAVGNRIAGLEPIQKELLLELAGQVDKPISHEHLIQEVMGNEVGPKSKTALRVAVHGIRSAFEDKSLACYQTGAIRTIARVGFCAVSSTNIPTKDIYPQVC
jgi:DNA-binding winged helix-turn-helix (wHTH) protein